MIFEQKTERGKGVSPVDIWGKCLIGREENKCNGPEACLRNHKMANMAGKSRQDMGMLGAVRVMRHDQKTMEC